MIRDRQSDTTRTADGVHADASSAAPIRPATAIGRFAVLATIGSGGMGLVYAAYDPQLDRRVALKLLHAPDDELERQRLVREAQALARLTHPNVVAVHEVGTHGEQLFVAMEFVEGTTLREWMDAHPPSDTDHRTRALEILREAARGIAAAHAAGLVHRDVKPRNILVGRDGRVCVADFGLARSESEIVAGEDDSTATTRPGEHVDPLSRSTPLLDLALTQTGKVVGTPAYMAPEQFRGAALDHRADQFSFCVTAWEVLFGVRPFAGNALHILNAIREGAIERPPVRGVSAELERALRRGLGFRVARRHADMSPLLTVLDEAIAAARGERRPRAGARAGWFVAAAAVIGAGVIVWRANSDEASCTGAEEHLAGIWDDDRKAEIRDAIVATEATFARSAWSRLEGNVDRWRETWIAGHRDACEAATVRKEQSPRLMDMRMACLDSRRQELVAYLDLLAAPTIDIVGRADEGFEALAAVDRCADADYVEHRGERPEDPQDAAKEDAILAEVARAHALHAIADFAGAEAVAAAAGREAEIAGLERAQAHALFVEGLALYHTPRDAQDRFERAHTIAASAGLSEVTTLASLQLAEVVGFRLKSTRDGRVWLRFARAGASRSGDRFLSARVDVIESGFLSHEGRHEAAIRLSAEAVAVLESATHEQPEYARALNRHAETLYKGGLVDQSLVAAVSAVDAASVALGPTHPMLGTLLVTESAARRLKGDLAGGRESALRAVAILQAHDSRTPGLSRAMIQVAYVQQAVGDRASALSTIAEARRIAAGPPEDRIVLAEALDLEAELLYELGDFEGSESAYLSALNHRQDVLGEQHPTTATTHIHLGAVERIRGRREEGARRMQLGRALVEDRLGSRHIEVAAVYDELGAAARADGDLEGARDSFLRAMEIVETAAGPRTILMQRALLTMCEISADLGRTDDALRYCADSLQLASQFGMSDPLAAAALHNNLGVALMSAHRNPEARASFERALSLWKEALGDRSLNVAIALANLGDILASDGDLAGARAAYTTSLSIREQALGTTHGMLAVPLIGIANVANSAGDHDDAQAGATRALEISTREHVDELIRARAQVILAIALAEDFPRVPTRSIALAEDALATFVRVGARADIDAERLRAWLAARAR